MKTLLLARRQFLPVAANAVGAFEEKVWPESLYGLVFIARSAMPGNGGAMWHGCICDGIELIGPV